MEKGAGARRRMGEIKKAGTLQAPALKIYSWGI